MEDSIFEFIRYDRAHGVGTLILNRPPVNVINISMLRELEGVLQKAGGDPELKVLQLRAEGKLFSAGVDVADHTPDRVDEMIKLFDRVCRSLAEFPVPTIAVVQGHALGGGCELVICCDMAWMADAATIGQPEIKLAVIAPIAALRLPAIVGPRWAAQILFSGEPVEAQHAKNIGLVNGTGSVDEIDRAVAEVTEQLTGLSASATRVNKRGYLIGMRGWQSAVEEMEMLYLDELMELDDTQEGLNAFIEKREPVWKNK
ncbi:MAG: enoyl-CoA hydratase/isomerase family protein [Anaerolineales bacterium]